jgi:ABC-type dipeptide/oligopeptide/nickel transport system, periplasmic component
MTYLEMFHSKVKDLNFAKYADPKYDELVDLAKVNQDNKTRMDAMKQAEKLLSDDFRYSVLYYEVGVYLINPKLKGVVIRSVGDSIDFYNASITK